MGNEDAYSSDVGAHSSDIVEWDSEMAEVPSSGNEADDEEES